jgi:predicted oxidoreductase
MGDIMSISRIKIAKEGPELSRVVYGAWRLTDRVEETSTTKVREKIDACLEVGMTTIDHADIYGDYRCEEVFGKALKENPSLRDDMELITKCGIKLISPGRPEHKVKHYDTSSAHIMSSVDRSLKNLETDYVDLLLIHRPDPLMDYQDTAKALEEVVKAGKVKSVGVSNFTTWQFEQLSKSLSIPLVTNQVEMSVLNMNALHDGTIGQCQVEGASPMAWSPLGGGRLFTGDDEQAKRVQTVLGKIADAQNSTIDQVALAWILRHPAKILPIIGTNNIERIKKSADSERIEISTEQWHEIWEASAGSEVP